MSKARDYVSILIAEVYYSIIISTSFPVPRVFHLANDMYPVPYSKLIEILKKRYFPQMESSSKQNIYADLHVVLS